jgi:hypothetical protein
MMAIWGVKLQPQITRINTATKRQKINQKFEIRNPGEMRKTGEIPENPVVFTIDKKVKK